MTAMDGDDDRTGYNPRSMVGTQVVTGSAPTPPPVSCRSPLPAAPVGCAHSLPWRVVQRVELDQPSPWAGRRYLRESCPYCCQWLASQPAPKVAR